jgi:hypothetical protein
VAGWDHGHPEPIHNVGMGLGRATQTFWRDGFMVIQSPFTMWGWVWVERPKPCWRRMGVGSSQRAPTLWGWVWVERPKPFGGTGSWSSRAHPQCGDGFESSDPNLLAGCVHGHPEPIRNVGMGLSRPTQTFWRDGIMVIQNPAHTVGMGLGLSGSN